MKTKLTAGRLKALLAYNPQTGVFTWKVATNGRRRVGEVAGSVKTDGYRQIKVDKRLYGAHRLAWLYVTGDWPKEEQIDHKNGQRDDNRLENLRELSREHNNQNWHFASRKNQSAKMLGVSRRNTTGGYQARIRVGGKEKRLGTFPTAQAAHSAYVTAKREFHPGNTL